MCRSLDFRRILSPPSGQRFSLPRRDSEPKSQSRKHERQQNLPHSQWRVYGSLFHDRSPRDKYPESVFVRGEIPPSTTKPALRPGLPDGNEPLPPHPTRHGTDEVLRPSSEDARIVWRPSRHEGIPAGLGERGRTARCPICWPFRYASLPNRARSLRESHRPAKRLCPNRSLPIKKIVVQILPSRPRHRDVPHGSWFRSLPERSSWRFAAATKVVHGLADQIRSGTFRTASQLLKIPIDCLLDMNCHHFHKYRHMLIFHISQPRSLQTSA